jgi:large subunit ribosomal protein L31
MRAVVVGLQSRCIAHTMRGPSRPAHSNWEPTIMKAGIHPEYKTIKVTCSCGHSFETRSTLGEELHVEVCSHCHPFFTGQQKIMDTAGRVDKFRRKYGLGASK